MVSESRKGICYFRSVWLEGNPRWLGHKRHRRRNRGTKAPESEFWPVRGRAPEPLEELEPEPEVLDGVQESPVPSQGDPAPNSTMDESSKAPSAAPSVAAPQDVNVLMFGLSK